MLDSEDHPDGDDAGNLEVAVVVPVRLVLAEEQRTTDLVAEMHRHQEEALVPGREHEPIAREGGIEFLRSLVEADRSARPHRCRVGELVGGDALDTGYGRFADRSKKRIVRGAGLEEDHAQRIEVDSKPDRVPQLLEDLADIQRGSDQLRDTGQASDAVPTPTLTVEEGNRLDEGSDQATGTAQPFDVHSVEGVRDATRRA